jgi:hypothetical protein
MVFLAITAAGLAEALGQAGATNPVWCGSDAISEADWAKLDAPDLSRFTYPLGDRALLQDAIQTIKEHHPGQTIWIEAP